MDRGLGPRRRRASCANQIEETGTGDAAQRIGQAPTTDVTDPERSSRNTAAGSGSEPGEGPVQPAADGGLVRPRCGPSPGEG
jgi:hypothetical protein